MTLENVIYHFPSDEQARNAESTGASWQHNASDAMDAFPGANRIIAHGGQEYYIRNVKMTVLQAVDMYDNLPLVWYNSTSLVIKIEDENHSFLVTGDFPVGVDTERKIDGLFMNMYSASTLKSDFVQVIHHGANVGGTDEFYQAADADYVLIPASLTWFEYYKNYDRHQYISTHGIRFPAGVSITVFTIGPEIGWTIYDNLDAYLAA